MSEHPFQGTPASLYESANYLMQLGGKRLRPAMVLMGCDAFKNSYETALPAAMAIEVFHNFTLVHDDIMDAAPLRRGKPTVHIKYNEPSAILCGDMMMFKSVMFLQMLPEKHLQEVLTVFNKTAIEVCEGQQLDMLFETRNDVSIDEYLHMIALKTSVLLGCSLKIGALVGGASNAEAERLYEFGKNLGIAFQLHDDILDAFAEDAEAFGKQVGGDILSNKKTYLLITAMKQANENQQAEISNWISLKNFDNDQKVMAMKSLFEATGARTAAEEEQQRYYTKALASLSETSLPNDTKKVFESFADMVMKRTK